jgi:ABC-2 type transport system ATP-binding protein
MPEADELSDRIALIDRGRLLALDTPENLKKQTRDGSLETFFIAKSGRGWET